MSHSPSRTLSPWRRRLDRQSPSRFVGIQFRYRPRFDLMEERTLLSSFVVSNTGDSGPGSLRQAIIEANAQQGANEIIFDPTAFATPQSITLTSGQLELSDTSGTETITGPAAGVTVSGGGTSRVFQIDSGVTASISGLTITDGNANNGGGLADYGGNLTLNDCTISSNSAGSGGGLYDKGGALILTDCNVSDNSAGSFGGGVFSSGPPATLTNCTLASNTAGESGGAIELQGDATLINCTLSGNLAVYGGGIDNFYGRYAVTVGNSIIAGNTGYLPDFSGAVVSLGNNLVGDTFGGSGWMDSDLTGTNGSPLDPLLARLGDYGGPTETMALLPGSPALGAGNNALIPVGVTTDQRGLPRIVNGTVDIGAFESSGFTIAVTSGSGQTAGRFAPLVATVTANNPIEPVAGGQVTFTPPASGASAVVTGSPATLSASGTASVTATSNALAGSYTVSATASGALGAASFSLTNAALVSIAVSPGSPELAVGEPGQFTATGNFADGSTADITRFVTWASATPSVATISATGLAKAQAPGTSAITASLAGVTSPADTLTVIAFDTFVVSNTGDSGPGSLRQAIEGANAQQGASDITFDPTAFATPQTITLTSGQLELSETTGTETITGPAAGVTVSGNNASRVFQVDANVRASISGLTITGGQNNYGGGLLNNGTVALYNCTITANSATGGPYANGGGLDNSGSMTATGCTITDNSGGNGGGAGLENYHGTATLINCTFSGNTASGDGGALSTYGGATTLTNCTVSGNAAHNGGGLLNNGSTTLTNCTVSDNSSYEGGGVQNISVSGTTTLTNCTLSNNTATYGGGMFNYFTANAVTLTNCALSDNSASFGGGLFNEATVTLTNCTVSGNSGDNGGGMYNGNFGNTTTPATATLTNCTVSGNSASYGGGIDNHGTATLNNCTVSGNSASDGGGLANSYGMLTLTNCTVSGNSATPGAGGGVNNLSGTTTLTNCTISGNSGGSNAGGGGVNNDFGTGTVTLTDCTISQNFAGATGSGGGVQNLGTGPVTLTDCTISGNTAYRGGGISNYLSGSTMVLINCTVSENSSTVVGGGGLENGGTLTLTDCTVSGNSSSDNGGGLANYSGGTLTLTNCTISGNSASVNGGGVYSAAGTTDTISNTIVAGNTAGTSGPDAFGNFISQGHNLIGETAASAGWVASDLTGTSAAPLDPLLAPLGDYGGPTQTMALLPGSPALGAGIAVAGLTTDQRGQSLDFPSPDIGAYQKSPTPFIVATAGGQLEGWLGDVPDTTFRIDVFASSAYNADGSGEEQDFLGSLMVTTDAAGEVSFAIPFAAPAGLPDLTATATDPQGETSDVSALRRAAFQVPTKDVREVPGQPVIFSSAGGDALALQDPDAGPLDPVWSLTLSVGSGTLTLSSTAGLTGSGDGTGALSYSGPLSALNAALQGLIFNPPAGAQVFATVAVGAQSYGAPPLQTQFAITDGVLIVDTTADSGPGSLRQAILNANTESGLTVTIDFAIPGAGVQTIDPVTPLPPITGSLLIDGSSQPGYAGTPLIALGGPSTYLTISGGSATVRGLKVSGIAIDPDTNERLLAVIDDNGLSTELTLLDSQGQALVRSDGLSTADPESVVDEYLAAGTYSLVSAGTAGVGDGSLSVTLTPAADPFQPIFLPPLSSAPMVVGDFTGDGILDIATPAGIYLGFGDGAFQDPISFGLSDRVNNYTDVVAGDFTGNGKLDLALTDDVTDTVVILLGNGDGTFQPAKSFGAGTDPLALVAGDFTGNGKLDLAVVDGGNDEYGEPGGLSMLLGNGDGTFQPAISYAAGDSPVSLVAGDFTGNGKLDLAVAYADGVSVLLGNGDGTFQPAISYAAGYSPASLVADDFTGNGKLDLAVADAGGVSVLLGNGDGTFRPAVSYAAGATPVSLVAGDFTGDGKLDLAVSDEANGELFILLGNGDGTFQHAKVIVLELSTGYLPSVVAADFNRDGRLDAAVLNGNASDNQHETSSFQVLLGNGDGTFQQSNELQQDSTEFLNIDKAAAADFTGDGHLDLATVDYFTGGVSTLLGSGNGTFQPARTSAVGTSAGEFRADSLVAGDFNGDGHIDLAVDGYDSQTGAGEVAVLLGNGDGTFQPSTLYPVVSGAVDIVAGDFSGNGVLDLAVLGSPGPGQSNGDVSILMGRGDGTFQPAVNDPVGAAPQQIVTGDFRADGKLDLAVLDRSSATVSVLLGNGDGTFQPAVNYNGSGEAGSYYSRGLRPPIVIGAIRN